MKIKELAQAAYNNQLSKLTEQWNLPIDKELHGEVTTTEYDNVNRERLTMRHIRQLRERVDQKTHAEFIAVMYNYQEPKAKPDDTAAAE